MIEKTDSINRETGMGNKPASPGLRINKDHII
jgi:hypothetical protein